MAGSLADWFRNRGEIKDNPIYCLVQAEMLDIHTSDTSNKPVIAIGAMGGSGTRVVAEILKMAGIFLGNNVNGAQDNLAFTRLFRDPEWYSTASHEEKRKRFELFVRYMSGSSFSLSDRWSMFRIARRNTNFNTDLDYFRRIMFYTDTPNSPPERWGWKEPNTQIYVKEISRFVPGVRYVHIIRHGLDMAFTGNKKQLRNWGHLFNIEFSDDDTDESRAVKQFDYWCRSNQWVVDQAGKYLGNDFLLLNYDRLCESPESELRHLLDFCEIEVPRAVFEEMVQLPRVPESKGRYKDHDLSFMNADRVQALESLGFKYEQ